jgi:hypothetical protein
MPSIAFDDLFSIDPNDFVATRDRLARELREEGDRDQAAEVKRLRRPAVPVWALNQVARTDPALVRTLLDAAAAARGAQIEVMNGADRTALRDALTQRRNAVDAVVAEAAAIIEHSGRSPATYERELGDTLNAITSDDALAEPLRTGHLVNIPAGDAAVDVFAGMPEPKPSRAKSDGRAAAAQRELEEAKLRLRAAEEAHRKALAVSDRAKRDFENAQRALEETDRERQAAQAAVDLLSR